MHRLIGQRRMAGLKPFLAMPSARPVQAKRRAEAKRGGIAALPLHGSRAELQRGANVFMLALERLEGSQPTRWRGRLHLMVAFYQRQEMVAMRASGLDGRGGVGLQPLGAEFADDLQHQKATFHHANE